MKLARIKKHTFWFANKKACFQAWCLQQFRCNIKKWKWIFFSPKKVKSSLTILLLSLSNSTSNLSFGGSCGNLRYWEKRRNKLTPGKASTTKGLKIPPPPPPVDFSLEESAVDSLLLLPVLLLLPFPLPPPTPLALLELVFEFLVLDLLAEEDFLLDLASVEVFAVWFVAEEDIIKADFPYPPPMELTPKSDCNFPAN